MKTYPELQGRVAVVTGASRGIGAAATEALAASGVAVVLAARSIEAIEALAESVRDQGGQAIACRCDVTSYADVTAAVERARDEFGRLDIMVNNAGAIDPIAHLAESDPDAWVRAADINYKGVYFGIRAVLPGFAAQGAGVVVNVSSGAAVSVLEGWSHYCSAKAAALALTRAAHLEMAGTGVRIVGLSPGTVRTEMQVLIKASGINPVSQLETSDHIPPEWAGRAIAWLCTDAARGHDGGDVSLRGDDIRAAVGLT
ncbi:MAG: SDR family NAD(P)-dependent oxidoreductase [Pseudomonadota bacterium]